MAKLTGKKLVNKTKKQEKSIDSIQLKRVTRSNTSETLLKIKEEEKSQSEIGLRVTRSSKIPELSSKLVRKIEQKERSQAQIPLRVTRSLKLKELSIKPKVEEKKSHNFDLPHVTRSLKKNTQFCDIDAPNPVTPPRTENRIEKRVNFIKLEKFEKNTVCLAKQKYSCPWPARIEKIEKDKVLVYFFGDKRVGYVQLTEIYDFTKSSEAIHSILFGKRPPRGFKTGLIEIEFLLGIDSTQSILNKI